MSFYNTTALTGDALKEAVARARSHNAAILEIFLNTRKGYGPSQIHALLVKAGRKVDINSVRRGMTDMTKKTKDLVMTGDKRPGQYGRDAEHVWEVNPETHPFINSKAQNKAA